jgi:4-amino-4-deoxy-L-arabinose transferase-like glycosyltransferase
MQVTERPCDPPRWAQWGVLLASIMLIWHSLGNHSLFPPDEGRYAAVSGWMAEHGNWLQPVLRDRLHVTKPPLTYWAQAVSIRYFGHEDLSPRLPSAIASTLTLLMLFVFARRTAGALVAMLAVGLLAVMPLFQIVGRLAITDPMLTAWWWMALCSAWFAVSSGRRHVGWIAAFWASSALIGLTKGPLVLAPITIVSVWLALAGRMREIRLLVPILGLPLAIAPLGFVAYGYWVTDPVRALAVWNFEFIDRFTGTSLNDPWWLLFIVFLAGFFPATTMLTLPWFNMTLSRAWAYLRAGDQRALLLVAVILPLVGFSILSRKSPTYILPLAPPLAMLVAGMLSRWVNGSMVDAPAGTKPPDVRYTTAIAMTGVGTLLPAAAIVLILRGSAPAWATGWTLLWLTLPVIPAMVATWIMLAWWPLRQRRLPALGVYFAAMVFVWIGFHHAEDVAMDVMGARPVARAVAAETRPLIVYRLRNLTIDWYLGRWLDVAEYPDELHRWIDSHPDGVVVLSDGDLAQVRIHAPELGDRLVARQDFDAWPLKKILFCDVVR